MEWAALDHAHGPADDVPGMIRALYGEASPETEDGESVLEELVDVLNHQGSLYPATPEAVPFLAHLAVHRDPHRATTLELLTALAETGATAAAAPLGARVRRAVLAELPTLTACLNDPDPLVRASAIRMTCVAPPAADPSVVRLLARLQESDASAPVRADAFTALSLLDPDPAARRRREARALTDHDPEVRLTAAMSALDRARPRGPASLVRIVAADGAVVAGSPDLMACRPAFPGSRAPRDREDEVLTRDPESALTVARAWIAAGDTGQRGSRLIVRLHERWRDHEGPCVAALAEALPQHPDGPERSWILRTIAGLMPWAGDPAPHIRDLLLAEAAADEPEGAAGSPHELAFAPRVPTREPIRGRGLGLLSVDTGGPDAESAGTPYDAAALGAGGTAASGSRGRDRTAPARRAVSSTGAQERAAVARTALAACGDLRVLDGPGARTASVVATLLTYHRDTALSRLLPVLPGLVAGGDAELLDALGPDLAATHLPWLKQALRERPTVAAARLAGRLGPYGADAETADLLTGPTSGTWPAALRAEAATSRALITGEAGSAVEELRGLLRTRYASDVLPAVGRLGALGEPLAGQVGAALNAAQKDVRSAAADAYWRVTRDPGPVLPLVLAQAAPALAYAPDDTAWYARRDALSVLAGMRAAGVLPLTPPELRPLLERCATSPHRVASRCDDEVRGLARSLLGGPES